MKRALRILTGLVVALAVAAIGVFAALLVTAERPARPVGFELLTVHDPRAKPLEVGIWYPTDSPPGFNVIGLLPEPVRIPVMAFEASPGGAIGRLRTAGSVTRTR